VVMYYCLEPSTLQNTTGQYATITDWQTNITAENGSASWDSYVASGVKFVDIYRKSTGAILKANVKVTRSGTTYSNIVLDADEIAQIKTNQPGGFPVGGVVAPFESDLLLLPAGKAEFSTIPYEFDQLLVLYACERVLESLGDTEGLQVVMAKIKETRDSISRVTGNRLQGERRKLTDRRSIARIQRGQKWTRNYNKNYT